MNNSEDKDKRQNPFDNLFPYKEGEEKEEEKSKESNPESKEQNVNEKNKEIRETQEKEIVEEEQSNPAAGFDELLDIGNESIINTAGKEDENPETDVTVKEDMNEEPLAVKNEAPESTSVFEEVIESKEHDVKEAAGKTGVMETTTENSSEEETVKKENEEEPNDMEEIISKEFDIESGKGAAEEVPESQFIEEAPKDESQPFVEVNSEVSEISKSIEPQPPIEEKSKSETKKEIIKENIDLSEIVGSLNAIRETMDLSPLVESINNLSNSYMQSINQINDSFANMTENIVNEFKSINEGLKNVTNSLNNLNSIGTAIDNIKVTYETNTASSLKEFQEFKIAFGALNDISENLVKLGSTITKQSEIINNVVDTTKSTNESVVATEKSIGKLVEKEDELLDTRKKETNIAIGLKHNDNGVFLFYNGKYESAINEFLKSLEYYPDNFDCLNNISLAYMKNNQLDKALEYANKAFEMNKDSFLINNTLGLIYLRMKELPKSEEYFNTAIKMNKNYIEPYINLGYMYKELKKFDKAIEMWEKVIDLDPTNMEIKQKLMELKEGKIGE